MPDERPQHRRVSRPRRCRACGYVLEHLPQPRCPECGLAFDPRDPRTFRIDDPAAARRADLQMAALSAVTALLFIAVPWMVCAQLRLLSPAWLAALAGGSAFLYTLGAANVFCRGPALVAALTTAPACLLLAAQAAERGQYLSLIAAPAGAALAAGLWVWWMRANANAP